MKSVLVLAMAFVSATAFAAKGGSYGMAGCGLGSLVFKENNSTQILAATTNGTFGSQTFGVTFGTSNCDASGKLFSQKDQVKDYVAANQVALTKEIAKGNGEALNGLADLMGIQDQAAFKNKLKANYGEMFPKKAVPMTAEQLTNKIYQVSNL